MNRAGSIRVLVVDDSILFREVISRGIATDPLIRVVGKAGDPFEARDEIIRLRPDVMICDVQMPRMNGIEFIRRLLPQYKLPVIVISGLTESVFDALSAGAFDFAVKPAVNSPEVMEDFLEQLIVKVKSAAVSQTSQASRASQVQTSSSLGARTVSGLLLPHSGFDYAERLIVIGASTGGTEAVSGLLQALPPDVPGMVVVQHIPPLFSRMFAERLNQSLRLQVKEARTGDRVEPGKVFVAPGDQHVTVRRTGRHFTLECMAGSKVNGHCPSVDVLFQSAAAEAKDKAIGILLTGMGQDGAKGLLALRQKGAHTIGQDEASSVVYGMPKAAYEMGAVEQQAALHAIPRLLLSMLHRH